MPLSVAAAGFLRCARTAQADDDGIISSGPFSNLPKLPKNKTTEGRGKNAEQEMDELFVCVMSQRRQTVTWIGSTGKRTRTRGSPFRRKCRSGVVAAEALCVEMSLVPTAARYLPLLGGLYFLPTYCVAA